MPFPYSAKLQTFVEALLARHPTALEALQVRLHLNDMFLLVMSQATNRRQVKLSRFVAMYNRPSVKDLEIVFFVDDQGHWIPYQYHRPPTDHQVCGVIDMSLLKLVIDNPSYQRSLASHCDLWATRLQNQGWLEQGMVFNPAELEFELLWPVPTVDEPDDDQIEAWLMDDICEATDGCQVELDGTCPHGHPSWLRRLGLV